MMKLKNSISLLLVPLNSVLFFLGLFSSRLHIPPWLAVFGRMHPLILHFPIVLCILYAVWILCLTRYAGEAWFEKVAEGLLLSAAFTAVLTAMMGLLLSREPGYDPDSIGWHEWTGIGVSVGLCIAYAFRNAARRHLTARCRRKLSGAIAILLTAGITLAGHLGGSITHGDNFVLAPVIHGHQRASVALEDAVVYQDVIEPILEEKCMSCHNSKKAKGKLVMETREALLKGGKDGKLWDSTAQDLGLLMERIHLSPDDKKHMPPSGKPQLSETEAAVLAAWIRRGSDFDRKVIDLPVQDSLRMLATGFLKPVEAEEYDFVRADEKDIRRLNNNYRVIYALATGSPALGVDFFGAPFFRADQLKELLPIKTQVVSMSLEKMPVADEDLKVIAQFSNLRQLNLSFTRISGTGLGELTKLSKLKTLALSGTAIKTTDIDRLSALHSLRQLYIWNTGIKPAEATAIQQKYNRILVYAGSRTDTMRLKLNPPILENEERILDDTLAVNLKHYVPGAIIRYTTDGTDPDSLRSAIYRHDLVLQSGILLKAKAFKTGWLSSDPVTTRFFSGRLRPDSIALVQPVDSDYRKYSAKILIDRIKGDYGFRSGKWLGSSRLPLECLLLFHSPVRADSVTISSLVDIGSSIMPPQTIEVWGGANPHTLRLLTRVTPEQPTAIQPAALAAYDLTFKPVNLKCIKLVMVPVAKLPDWHPFKGTRGFVFADEIFIN
jgi:uncharacterized membrane protein